MDYPELTKDKEDLAVELFNAGEVKIYPEGINWKFCGEMHYRFEGRNLNSHPHLLNKCAKTMFELIYFEYGKYEDKDSWNKIAAMPEASTSIVDVMTALFEVPNIRYRTQFQKYKDASRHLKEKGMDDAAQVLYEMSQPKINGTKTHGNGLPFIGEIEENDNIVIIDNAISSGGSILEGLGIYNDGAKSYDKSLEIGDTFKIDKVASMIVNSPQAIDLLEGNGITVVYLFTPKSFFETLWKNMERIDDDKRIILEENKSKIERDITYLENFSLDSLQST